MKVTLSYTLTTGNIGGSVMSKTVFRALEQDRFVFVCLLLIMKHIIFDELTVHKTLYQHKFQKC